ncbi:hypothetical protein L6452_39373 [Arctium lappa]|uniref:Uncharacterized protein n=1 Tax=Arctium lappa TaxID=4217 RepID=A0ACB8XST2_ARCLA|nr:hypothetical protein L6452_39373 [Arctium lappa]
MVAVSLASVHSCSCNTMLERKKQKPKRCLAKCSFILLPPFTNCSLLVNFSLFFLLPLFLGFLHLQFHLSTSGEGSKRVWEESFDIGSHSMNEATLTTSRFSGFSTLAYEFVYTGVKVNRGQQ